MSSVPATDYKVTHIVPLLRVSNLQKAIRFYVDGLGFEKVAEGVDGHGGRWCRLSAGDVRLTLRDGAGERDGTPGRSRLGDGVTIVFICEDALAIYREAISRGIDASEPVVGNNMWETTLRDPDGYRLQFESETTLPEDTKLSEVTS